MRNKVKDALMVKEILFDRAQRRKRLLYHRNKVNVNKVIGESWRAENTGKKLLNVLCS